MMKNNTMKRMIVLAVTILLLILSGCEDFKTEEFTMNATDARGVASLSDTLVIPASLWAAGVDDDVTPTAVTLISPAGSKDTIAMSIAGTEANEAEIYAALATHGLTAVEPNDTCYALTISADSTRNFTLLEIPVSGTYIVYFRQYAHPHLYTTDGTAVPLGSDGMSPELIAGYYTLGATATPAVRGRFEYTLSAGSYLFEVERLESTASSSFRIAWIDDLGGE